jgi:hypothetical protein
MSHQPLAVATLDAVARKLAGGPPYVLDGHETGVLLGLVKAALEQQARDQARERRNGLLRELADAHYSHLAPSAQARVIAKAAAGYAAVGWLRDRHRAECPAYLAGRPEAFLWRIMKLATEREVHFPLMARQVENILKSRQSTRTQNKALEIA